MGGFKNQSLNMDFTNGLFATIIMAIKKSCELMLKNNINNGDAIENHEEKIRTHLLENYLDKDELRADIGLSDCHLRFWAESPENYDPLSNSYIGRTDIKVASKNWFNNRNDYFIIECKRLDGTTTLSKKYVTDGVSRFIGSTPKYSSYHKKNFMVGFIVRDIDFIELITDISSVHISELGNYVKCDISIKENDPPYYLCESEYVSGLLLAHVFYDFSSIVA